MDYKTIFNNLVQAFIDKGYKVIFKEKKEAWDNGIGILTIGKVKQVVIRETYTDEEKVHILAQLSALEAMSTPNKYDFVITEKSLNKPGFIKSIADFSINMIAAAYPMTAQEGQ